LGITSASAPAPSPTYQVSLVALAAQPSPPASTVGCTVGEGGGTVAVPPPETVAVPVGAATTAAVSVGAATATVSVGATTATAVLVGAGTDVGCAVVPPHAVRRGITISPIEAN